MQTEIVQTKFTQDSNFPVIWYEGNSCRLSIFVALYFNTPLVADDDDAASNDMFDWLRNDKSQTSQPWIIIAFHHATYSSSDKHGYNSRVQFKIIPIFKEYGVDVATQPMGTWESRSVGSWSLR